jgi:hypothetical protein
MKEFVIKYIVSIGFALLHALIIMQAWDMSMPELFGLPKCSFINALGLTLLTMAVKWKNIKL